MEIFTYVDKPSVDLRIFDFLRSQLFAIGSAISVEYGCDRSKAKNADKKILFSSMPSRVDHDFNEFDLVLFSNADEPTTVATDCLIENLGHPKARLIANAWVHQSHPLSQKILPFNNDFLVSRQYWTNAFFPQYHNHQSKKKYPRTKDFVFVNGQNRSWRQYAMEELLNHVPRLTCHSVLSSIIHETNDAPWETSEDTAFREFTNNRYAIIRNTHTSYYDDSILVKIPSTVVGLPHGDCSIPPGYFIMDLYYQYRCVIFPESNWKNYEASPTEKIAKCFFSKSLPWPVGGAKINQIYNTLGFQTAWNLLPASLQTYDDEVDHVKRYHKMAQALCWLVDNPAVLDSNEYRQILEQNYTYFLCNELDSRSVSNLTTLLIDQ
jgi:hypothetical protein